MSDSCLAVGSFIHRNDDQLGIVFCLQLLLAVAVLGDRSLSFKRFSTLRIDARYCRV